MAIRMQSCEGTTLANGKYFRSQSSFAFPKVSMDSQPSAPLIAAAITKNRINMDTLGRIEHGVFA
jgi:hypothetical protein